MLVEISNLTKRKINLKKLEKFIYSVLKDLKLKHQVSLVLVGKRRMKTLNNTWRKNNKSTDVLTFINPNLKDKEEKIVEIFINLDDCEKINKYQEFFENIPSKEDILYWLLIHGILHSANYNDANEKEREEIIKEGKKIFKKMKKGL